MNKIDYKLISKNISSLLKTLKKDIKIKVNDFLDKLNTSFSNKKEVDINDLEYIYITDKDIGFEIINDEINIISKPHLKNQKVEVIPPILLFAYLEKSKLKDIKEKGIKKEDKIKLYLDLFSASSIKNKSKEYVGLIINSLDAYNSNTKFYLTKNDIYLSDDINKEFIEIIE